MEDRIYTTTYTTTWPECHNVVIALHNESTTIPIGIVEVRVHRRGGREGEAYIWNLHVDESHRGHGYGQMLLDEATAVAISHGCHAATLDWLIEEAPRWVFDWYVRQGFDEREFSYGCAYMVKELEGGEG